MSDVAIEISGLGKRYRYGGVVTVNDTLGAELADWAKGLFRRSKHESFHAIHERHMAADPHYFWALKDINLDIKQGEVVGIIGRNGAGKSTLLKILSRITPPTEGRINYHGRMASLLEVGTGFHRELTGRENIFLNGSILGMKRAEIACKFDAIVAFAEIEKFIDTPVKFYSSGMYVRLAFAVAAHLEPDILIVDEVLAVGDLAFQNKCLGKMEEVSAQGRTVLFVSHNMQAVRALCSRAVLLQEGRMICDGPAVETIERYNKLIRDVQVRPDTAVHIEAHRRGSGAVRFSQVRVEDIRGNPTFTFEYGSTIRFALTYKVFSPVKELFISVLLWGGKGREIVTTARHQVSDGELPAGREETVVIEFPNASLRPGEYPLYFWLGNAVSDPFDVVDELTLPLTISTRQGIQQLGFEPSRECGFFSIPSRLSRPEPVPNPVLSDTARR